MRSRNIICRYPEDAKLFKTVRELDARGRQVLSNRDVDLKLSDVDVVQLDADQMPKKIHRTSALTALKAGTSSSMVERIRVILDFGTPTTILQLEQGLITTQQAYHLAKEERLAQSLASSPPTPEGLTLVFQKLLESPRVRPQEKYTQPRWTDDEVSLMKDILQAFKARGFLTPDQFFILDQTLASLSSPH